MKYIKYIYIAIAVAFAFACTNEGGPGVEADNNFTFESEAPQWCPDTLKVGPDTLKFDWVKSSATVDVLHGVTSNEWDIKTSLNDAWATYSKKLDEERNVEYLTVKVEANIGTSLRQTYVDVRMGENVKRIIILQNCYPGNQAELPSTEWDEGETEWTNSL